MSIWDTTNIKSYYRYRIPVFINSIFSINLSTESIQGATLAFERIYNIKGGDSLSLGVLSVGDSVTDNVFKESLEHSTGLFIDETRDALDTSPSGQTANSGLSDSLNVVAKNLAMTFGTSFSESFSSLSSSSHLVVII